MKQVGKKIHVLIPLDLMMPVMDGFEFVQIFTKMKIILKQVVFENFITKWKNLTGKGKRRHVKRASIYPTCR
ncbi:MAG: hypothetical protein IIB40_08490 [Candidatus Marinimicrobia bacterium]|nr:hypothetical protein [Candidatus Neomarinimicrobiota bacterium]